jgi:4-carboxymuconolactone decarboxylase
MTDRLEKGREILRRTVGDEYFERRRASTNAFNRPLRELTDEYCFGTVWAQGPLDAKTCSLLVITMLAVMGRIPELQTHVGGAINNGLTPEEISHAMLMVGAYAGIPAGVEATRTAEAVLRERGLIA